MVSPSDIDESNTSKLSQRCPAWSDARITRSAYASDAAQRPGRSPRLLHIQRLVSTPQHVVDVANTDIEGGSVDVDIARKCYPSVSSPPSRLSSSQYICSFHVPCCYCQNVYHSLRTICVGLSLLSSTPPSAPPPEVTHDGLKWILTEHTANKRKNTTKSRVWQLGHEYRYVGP
jgi:hypothetical protein